MSDEEAWYRSGGWEPADQELFEQKLKRSRTPYNRAQYIKLKAYNLMATGDTGKRRTAIQLLRRAIDQYGGHEQGIVRSMVRDCVELLGQAYEAEGMLAEAEDAYRAAISALEWRPRTSHKSELRLAELIVRTRQRGKFDEARKLISLAPPFNDERFAYLLSEARMAALEGEERKAAVCAGAALGIFKQQTPPLKRLPGFGMAHADQATLEELERYTSFPSEAEVGDADLLPGWVKREIAREGARRDFGDAPEL